MAVHFEKLQVEQIRRETADAVSIAFAIPPALREKFRYTQGQNITIRAQVGGSEIRRSYSICSSPLENELRIAVKKVPGGLFSCYANDRLQLGDQLEVLPPSGKFYTPVSPTQARNYLAFAAGSGITPLLSIIKTVLAVEPESQFTLVYGNRSRSSIIFREELEGLKNRYMRRFALHHILSRERTDSLLHQGRIDAEKCAGLCGPLIRLPDMDEVFICGPRDMTFAVRGWLEQAGIDKKKIHFELFNTQEGRPVDEKAAAAPDKGIHTGKVSHVTVRLDGTHYDFDLPFDGDPILEAALRQGADLPYACKGGVCCTCRARLQEGQVEMDLNYALESDELEQGFILTCQSHPRTERVIVDFDQK